MSEPRDRDIRIVPFREDLLGQVVVMYQMAWGTETAYAERFTDTEARDIVLGLPDIWAALAEQEIVGFVAGIALPETDDGSIKAEFENQDDVYYIDSLVVSPAHRRKGHGGRLLSFAIAAASGRGYSRFLLRTTLHGANQVHELYRRHGFTTLLDRRQLPVVRIARQPRLDGRDESDCRLYMIKTVPPEPIANSDVPRNRLDFALAVRRGLLKPGRKTLPSRFIYDAFGSALFEKICELPEYYPTRCEAAIIKARSKDIAALCGPRVAVVEMGAGSAGKTRSILSELLQKSSSVTYLPIDISTTALQATAQALRREYTGLTVHPLEGEYEAGLRNVDHAQYDTVLALWLGTSIGNVEAEEARHLLQRIGHACGPNGFVVLGVDLKKDKVPLEQAYDDAQGVTAQFNLNLLGRINRELGGHFDLQHFRHRVIYDEVIGRIEMHIESCRKQAVVIDSLGVSIALEQGEWIHTENSYKFSSEEIDKLAWSSGFRLLHHWRDADRKFSVNVLQPAPQP